MNVWCPDDHLNCFHWISMIFGIYVICVQILDGFEYQHHTSLNMCIMADHVTSTFLALMKSIFQLNLYVKKPYLRGTRDISSGFSQIPIRVFFRNFYTFSTEPVVCPWLFGIWMVTQILFYWILKICGICILWVEIFHGIEYQFICLSIHPAFGRFQWGLRRLYSGIRHSRQF